MRAAADDPGADCAESCHPYAMNMLTKLIKVDNGSPPLQEDVIESSQRERVRHDR